MSPDRVEVSWVNAKSQWLVRIVNGEEVIRRHCDLPRNSSEQEVLSAAQKTAEEEGFNVEPGSVVLLRESA